MALAIASAATVVTLIDPMDATGTVITFTATANNAAWTTAGNWSPSQIPGINDDIIIPGGSNQMGASNTTISFKTFTFNGSTSRVVADQSTAANNTVLIINGSGANPLINVTGGGGFTFQGPNGSTGSGTLGIQLNASGDFNVDANGTLVISANIIDASNPYQPHSINKTGAGVATLSGTNTFAGSISVSGGTLVLSGPNAFNGGLTIADGAAAVLNGTSSMNPIVPNKVIFSGANGTLQLGVGVTIGGFSAPIGSNQIVQAASNAQLVIKEDNNAVFNGALLDGTGTLSLSKVGGGTVVLTNGNTAFTGQISITDGTLFADHIGNNARKLGVGTNALVMQGGIIAMNGTNSSPGPDVVESFGSTTFNGGQSVVQVASGGTPTRMSLGPIGRGSTATADFVALVGGIPDVSITTTTANDANGILGPWATVRGDDWATVNISQRIIAFTGYTAQDDPSLWTSTDQITYGSQTGSITASSTVTSLRMDAIGTQPILTVNPGATLTLGNGGLLVTSHDGAGSITGGGVLTAGTTNVASNLFVHTVSTLIVDSIIANNTAGGTVTLVKSGTGVLQLTASNTYTGDTVINRGSIALTQPTPTSPAILTNKGVAGPLGAGNNIQLNGGTLVLHAEFGSPQSTNRDIQIGSVGGIDAYGEVTLSGNITDGFPNTPKGALNLDGPGIVHLTGVSNNYKGGTYINSGVLSIASDTMGSTNGSVELNGGSLSIDGSFVFNGARTFVGTRSTMPIGVSGTNTATLSNGAGGFLDPGGTLVKYGTGTLALGLNIPVTTSKVLVTDGILAIAADAQLGSPAPSTLVPDALQFAGGTLRFFSNGSQGLGLNSNRGIYVASSGTLDFAFSSGAGFINDPISGPGRLYKNGPATVSSNTSHSFSGGLDIIEGRWNVTTSGAAGLGSIILEGGSTLASVKDGAGGTLAVAQLGIGSVNLNATVTVPNDILLVGPVGAGTNSFEVNTTDNLILTGVISGTGGIGKGQVGATTGTLTFSGSNTYSGPTNIALGALVLGANGVIPDTSAVSVSAPATVSVNGMTETIGSLLGAGTVNLGNGGALTMGADNTSATYSGALIGTGTVTKIGTGTQTFSGSNTYTGLTTVKAGNLTLNGALAQGRVVTGGGADIQGGRMVFGDTTNSATIKSLLTASYNNNLFNNATQIHSSTATSLKGLGFVDDGTKVTVAYTFYGDANLDGTVNTGDFNALASNFNATGKSWVDGDFNYDGIVNALDFNAVATNFGQTLPPPGPGAALGTLVPEPGAIALVSVGLLALRRRKHRKMH